MKSLLTIPFLLFSFNILVAQSMVKDIYPNNGSSPAELTAVGNTVFFSANDGKNGIELWKSDGTDTGTVMVKDINPSGSSTPKNLIAFKNKLYFSVYLGSNYAIWESNGTDKGTKLVKSGRGLIGANGGAFHVMNNNLYFCLQDDKSDYALWKSDGTPSGTVLVKDISTSSNSTIYSICSIKNTLYFIGNGGSSYELWKSDGTTSGTSQIKAGLAYATLTANNGAVYFVQDGNTELWKSDGTSTGTVMVKDLGASASIAGLISSNNILYFSANDSKQGRELWTSDGTANGTSILKDIYSGKGSSSPNGFQSINGELYFAANDSVHGIELWKSDGTAKGTILINDNSPGAISSNPANFTDVNGVIYFSSYNYKVGTELWSTDGTLAGTRLVMDINVGNGASYPSQLTNVKGTLYFRANDIRNGNNYELWSLEPCKTYTPQLMSIYNNNEKYNAACADDSITLLIAAGTLNGGKEWKWYADSCGGTAVGTGDVIKVAPTNTTGSNITKSYFVRAEGGCVPANGTVCGKIDITVLPTPKLNIVTTDSAICLYKSTLLTATGAQYYTWGNGLGNGDRKNVYPRADSTFSVIGYSTLYFYNVDGYNTSTQCYGKEAQITIKVNPLPVVSAGKDRTVCSNARVTLKGSGAKTYQWSYGRQDGVAFISSSASAISYVLTATDSNGCQNKDTVDIITTSDLAPKVYLSSDVTSVCQTGNVELTVNGDASLYSWSHGLGGGTAKTVAPKTTTTFEVTGTATNGCTNTDSRKIIYSDEFPSFTVTADKDSICEGEYTWLRVDEQVGVSYYWPGFGSGTSRHVGPTATTTYLVTGDNGCITTDSITLTVNPKPVVTVSANTTALCGGGSATLTVNGDAVEYLWTDDLSTGSTLVVTPKRSTTYYVTGTSKYGCKVSNSIRILADSVAPTLNIKADFDTICNGEVVKLSAYSNSAQSYTWSHGLLAYSTQTVKPSKTTTYLVTASNGCLKTDSITITVNETPYADIGPDTLLVCDQQLLTFKIDTLGQNIASYYIANFTNTVNNDSLSFVFNSSNPIVAVYSEATGKNGCVGKDRVLLIDNRIDNMSMTFPSLNDPSVSFSIANMPTNVDFWYWDFGDGDTLSRVLSPTHIYTENGYIRACLFAINECGIDSSCVQFNITNAVGINEYAYLNNVKAYPNPSSGAFQIEGLMGTNLVVVRNYLGQEISKMQVTANTLTLDLTQQPKGVYFLQLNTTNAQRIIRLIKH